MMRGMYRRKLKDFAELQKEQSTTLLERFKAKALQLSSVQLEDDDEVYQECNEDNRHDTTNRRIYDKLKSNLRDNYFH